VDGCGLTLEDILPLKAEIPGLTPVERSAATLGVRSSGYQQFLENGGCEIAGVSEGLAADKAGLRNSFIIKAVNGDPIVTFDDGTSKSLVHRLRDCAPGETVTLTVQRTISAQPEEVQVTLSDWSDVADVQMIGGR
jgi:S1-C subfamily serine protease